MRPVDEFRRLLSNLRFCLARLRLVLLFLVPRLFGNAIYMPRSPLTTPSTMALSLIPLLAAIFFPAVKAAGVEPGQITDLVTFGDSFTDVCSIMLHESILFTVVIM